MSTRALHRDTMPYAVACGAITPSPAFSGALSRTSSSRFRNSAHGVRAPRALQGVGFDSVTISEREVRHLSAPGAALRRR